MYWEGICYIVLENPAFRVRDWRLFLGKQPAPLRGQKPTYPNDPTTCVKTWFCESSRLPCFQQGFISWCYPSTGLKEISWAQAYCQGNKKRCYGLIQPFTTTVLPLGKAVSVGPWSQEGGSFGDRDVGFWGHGKCHRHMPLGCLCCFGILSRRRKCTVWTWAVK